MPITLSETIEDSNQGSFRYVRFRFTFDTGEQVVSGPHMLSLAQDATAIRTQLISVKEQEMADAEAAQVLGV